MSEGDKTKGAYGKYKISRLDGSTKKGGKHRGCRFFVLDLDHDLHAAAALRAYAKSCMHEFSALSSDLLYAAIHIEQSHEDPEDGVDLGFAEGHIWA